jgi:hypothetical protein
VLSWTEKRHGTYCSYAVFAVEQKQTLESIESEPIPAALYHTAIVRGQQSYIFRRRHAVLVQETFPDSFGFVVL